MVCFTFVSSIKRRLSEAADKSKIKVRHIRHLKIDIVVLTWEVEEASRIYRLPNQLHHKVDERSFINQSTVKCHLTGKDNLDHVGTTKFKKRRDHSDDALPIRSP